MAAQTGLNAFFHLSLCFFVCPFFLCLFGTCVFISHLCPKCFVLIFWVKLYLHWSRKNAMLHSMSKYCTIIKISNVNTIWAATNHKYYIKKICCVNPFMICTVLIAAILVIVIYCSHFYSYYQYFQYIYCSKQ